VSWCYSKAYGSGTSYHEGVLTELDDWIRVSDSPRSPGYLQLPITAVVTVEGITVEKKPADTQPKPNPFVTKRKIPGKS